MGSRYPNALSIQSEDWTSLFEAFVRRVSREFSPARFRTDPRSYVHFLAQHFFDGQQYLWDNAQFPVATRGCLGTSQKASPQKHEDQSGPILMDIAFPHSDHTQPSEK